MVRSSSLDIDPTLAGEDRVIAIVRELGGTRYVNPSGGRELYAPDAFSDRGLRTALPDAVRGEYGKHPHAIVAGSGGRHLLRNSTANSLASLKESDSSDCIEVDVTDSSENARLTGLVAEILRVPKAEIADSLDMEATSTWDSLSHMQLIAAIEDEFAIELTADDIVAMRSLGKIKEVLRTKSVSL